MSAFFYFQRTREPGRHRGRPAARRSSHVLSFLSTWPWLATGRHLAGLIASAVLLALAVALAVWAVL